MAHSWTGFLCLSHDHAPSFGRIAPNVSSAICKNAVGVTKGTIAGTLAADLACGEDNPLIADMESLGEPNRLPPRPLLDIGMRARFAWEIWRAGRSLTSANQLSYSARFRPRRFLQSLRRRA